MKHFITKNFVTLILGIVVLLLILQRCNAPKIDTPEPVIVTKIDTVFTIKDSIVYRTPKPIKIIIRDTLPQEFTEVSKQDCDSLRESYISLAKRFTAQNIYKDTLKLDSVGQVVVNDTTYLNELVGRSYEYKYSIPTITKTITITTPQKPKNQLYFGGGLEGNKTNIINQINAGLLLKNKKDQIFGITTGIDITGQVNYGINSYWKIKL
jgi:hypothetical protein